MAQTFRIAVVSDIHYAAAAERERIANFDHRSIKNLFARWLGHTYEHFIWLRQRGAHNALLDQFIADAGQPDVVVANGDYSCNTGHVGLSDDAAFASAEECLGKMRGRFDGKLHATIGDHDLGKVGLFSGHGNMAMASWQRLTERLHIEPFWRVQLGNYVLLGLTSSLLALPLYHADLLPGEVAAWEQLRATHLQNIRAAFASLQPDQRLLLFCHDPTALPFLLREEIVREKISQVEQTIIGHLHTNLVLRTGQVIAGFPTIKFLGKGAQKISAALGQARQWRPFHLRLCPSLTGIQMLKDGGFLTADLAGDASRPAKFELHRIKW